jgi:hypothetical protein
VPDFFNRGYVNRPFGMPELDTQSVSQMFSQIAPLVNSMKNDDAFRQRQMMEFENSLRMRRPMENAADRPELITRGPNAMKRHVTQYAPPTAMQQQFAREGATKANPGALAMENAGKFNNAMLAAKMRTDEETARLTQELNAKHEDRAYAEAINARRRSEKLEDDKSERDFKSKEAQDARNDKGWLPTTIDDPNNPGQKITARMNAATGEVEPITIKGKQVTGAQKLGAPGTKAVAGQPAPEQLAGIRETTQSVLDELDQMLTPEGKLREHMQAATGPSNIPGTMLDKFGLGALAPKTKLGKSSINTFKSKLIIDLIGKMKAQSKTGATGFGQMNAKELNVLETAIGKLDPDMPDDAFEAELVKIQQKLRNVMKDAPDPSKGKKPTTPEEYMRKYGGGA